jgi:hypothetical protein
MELSGRSLGALPGEGTTVVLMGFWLVLARLL